jgi:hypothetical protein
MDFMSLDLTKLATMSDSNPNQQDPSPPNGSESEPDPPSDDNETHVEAPACAKWSRCHAVIEKLKAGNLLVKRLAAERKRTYQTALDRRERAFLKKDTEYKSYKMTVEAKVAMAKAQADVARQAMAMRHKKEVEDLKLRWIRTEATLKQQASNSSSSLKLQALEARKLQSELVSSRLAKNKSDSAHNKLQSKFDALMDECNGFKRTSKDLEKDLKSTTSTLNAAKKRVDHQMEMKFDAQLKKEELRVKREEVALRRDEFRKNKRLEINDHEYHKKIRLQEHRFECMSKVHTTKEKLKKKTHNEKLDDASARVQRAQAIHQGTNGTFPGIGGGPASVGTAMQWYNHATSTLQPTQQPTTPQSSSPPLFVQQTLTQMAPTMTSTTSFQDEQPDLLPAGWIRLLDPSTQSPVFVHQVTGKIAKTRLDIYKTPPRRCARRRARPAQHQDPTARRHHRPMGP